ncbi:calcineurin-like phosphoesterase family protein [Pseudarthrobacter sulfonivorans]|nr:calcineurin-like phosphoesterase family protein [Pseudarthrobacter sulfonivorans]
MSDLHFLHSNPYLQPDTALRLAGEALVRDFGETPLVLVISGDITTHGAVAGFHEALLSINQNILSRVNVSKTIICPGNHDIVEGDKGFKEFNKFAFSLTGSEFQIWNEERPVAIEMHEGYCFLLVNTSAHADYTFGKVPLEALERALDEGRTEHQIVVLHHSPISSSYGGEGLADSYELLSLAGKKNCVALLHGHVHSNQILTIGRQSTIVSGVGSLGFTPDPNMNNQFSTYSFDGDALVRAGTYRYLGNRRQFELSELRVD